MQTILRNSETIGLLNTVWNKVYTTQLLPSSFPSRIYYGDPTDHELAVILLLCLLSAIPKTKQGPARVWQDPVLIIS